MLKNRIFFVASGKTEWPEQSQNYIAVARVDALKGGIGHAKK